MDDRYTFTVQTEDIDTLEMYARAIFTAVSVENLRRELRSMVKYPTEEVQTMTGIQMAEKIQEMFWELFPEA